MFYRYVNAECIPLSCERFRGQREAFSLPPSSEHEDEVGIQDRRVQGTLKTRTHAFPGLSCTAPAILVSRCGPVHAIEEHGVDLYDVRSVAPDRPLRIEPIA